MSKRLLAVSHSDAHQDDHDLILQTKGSESWELSTKLIYACFFLSGFSALLYEVAWLNRIQLVMGHTVYSLATTVSSYLAGLALGALLVTRVLRSGLNPLMVYFVAEALIGLYGLCFSQLMTLMQIPYGFLVTQIHFSLPVLSLVQFVFCGTLILVPTVLMGMTLPLLAHALYRRPNELSEKLPTLYAVNTLGAAIGSAVTGFLILPNLGYERAVFLGAGINIAILFSATVSGSAIVLPTRRQWAEAFKRMVFNSGHAKVLEAKHLPALCVLFISGCASMMVQVIWNRLSALGFGPSAYIFPLVTSVVLFGIVLGSVIFRRVSMKRPVGKTALVFLPAAAGFAFLIGNYALTKTPSIILSVHQTSAFGFWSLTAIEFIWLSICCIIPAGMLGVLFPVSSSDLTRDHAQGANALGFGYAINIFGLLTGAIVGGFWLLPSVGIERMSILLFTMLVMTSVVLAVTCQWRPLSALSLLLMGAISLKVMPAYDWQLLTSGYFYNRVPIVKQETLQDFGFSDVHSYMKSREVTLVAHRDDAHATVSIHQGTRRANDIAFKINGKVDGNNSSDLRTTRFVALLPSLVRTDFQTVLTIGLGIGSTVTETLRYPQIKTTKVVELSRSMVEFSRQYFPDVNGALWNDRRFALENRDGRDFLEHTKESYDLIISEPSNPWVDGVGSLFTQEYYTTISQRLTSRGIAALWFHSYGLDCNAVRSVLAAASSAFKSLQVFKLGGDLYMLGSNDINGIRLQPIDEKLKEMEADLFNIGEVPANLERVDAYRAFFDKNFLFDRDGVQRYVGSSEVNRDDNQILQYSSGRTFFQHLSCGNYNTHTNKADAEPYVNQILARLPIAVAK